MNKFDKILKINLVSHRSPKDATIRNDCYPDSIIKCKYLVLFFL